MLSQLIQTPSVSSNDLNLDKSNIDVIHLIANWLDDLGFNTVVKPLERDKNKANLIACKGSGTGGIVFSGHSDTVPCSESDWTIDPYELTERNGNYFGLGTCDMKGFFPIALHACAQFAPGRLKKPVCIAVTSDEETSMAGARELVEKDFPKADAVVIGEPTDLVPAFTHKGMAILGVKIRGKAGHSSNPEEGNNAIDVLHQIIGELMKFRDSLRTRFSNDAFAVDYPTLNLGCVHAGDAPNRICSHAEMLFDIRVLPRMDTQSVLSEVQRLIQNVAHKAGAEVEASTASPYVPPYETSIDSRLIRHLEAASKKRPTGVAFGTEAPFFQALGMETVIFGPGSVKQAHQPDEYIAGNSLKPTQDILEGLVHTYCVDC